MYNILILGLGSSRLNPTTSYATVYLFRLLSIVFKYERTHEMSTGISYQVLSRLSPCRFFSLSHKKVLVLTETQEKQITRLTGLPIVHHHGYVCYLPPNHRFPMCKFHKVYGLLVRNQVIDKDKQVVEPCRVSEEMASCVHTAEYVDKFFSGKTSKDEQRVTGFEWSAGLASRVRFETGGTLLAGYLSLKRGLASSTAGGTHHAFPSHGAGFCLINDLAVTAQHLVNTGAVGRVLIVDLDVHQGDGTAYIFRDTKSVFTFSMHCGKNFPFRKQKSDLDVPLDVNTEDDEYISILQDHLPHILDSFRPDLVLYDAGVDSHWDDELGKLRLTDEGLFLRDKYVIDTVVGRGISIATVIGGGYDQLDRLASRHTIVHRAAAKVWHDRGL